MSGQIKLSSLSGIWLEIAKLCDIGGEKDVLDEHDNIDEVSIFEQAKKDFKEKSECTINGKVYSAMLIRLTNMQKEMLDKFKIKAEVPDALRVSAKENAKIAAENTKEKKEIINKDAIMEKKIEKVTLKQAIIHFCIGTRINKKGEKVPVFAKELSDIPEANRQDVIAKAKENAKKITPMVKELCQKYEIEELAPVIAYMLGIETGGYVFTKEKMDPQHKKYKGVMQVDYENCQCIFSELPATKKGWRDKCFSQDDARIEELKKKYKTAKNLYNALKTDIKLGLGVGIIAYKAKLREAKGDVHKAVSMYCGSQYKYPFDDIPKTYKV